MSIHTIFVPIGWSVEQTWEHIKRGVPVLVDNTAGSWVSIDDETEKVVVDDED